MKLCRACGNAFQSRNWRCPACSAEPARISGFPALAPELADRSPGYRPEFFAEMAALEERSFWFRARNRYIIWALQRYFPSADSLLEVGCGTGYVLSGVSKACPRLQLAGSEISSTGLKFASTRVEGALLLQMDARDIPFDCEFDVIGAFDVLEHIEEDERVLSQMYRAVTPGGGVILTVPQHAFLWSQQDVNARHVRRYEAADLKSKVIRAGFLLERVTSFISLLLPLMFFSRYRKRGVGSGLNASSELRIPRLADLMLEKTLDLERLLVEEGVSFPAGGSLLMVARKPNNPS